MGHYCQVRSQLTAALYGVEDIDAVIEEFQVFAVDEPST
jgi:hypothetical protein